MAVLKETVTVGHVPRNLASRVETGQSREVLLIEVFIMVCCTLKMYVRNLQKLWFCLTCVRTPLDIQNCEHL